MNRSIGRSFWRNGQGLRKATGQLRCSGARSGRNHSGIGANRIDHEVPTNAIGIRVMERLHSMDEVAYIRYASVYRQFQDIGEFINEIESLGRKTKRNALQPDLFAP